MERKRNISAKNRYCPSTWDFTDLQNSIMALYPKKVFLGKQRIPDGENATNLVVRQEFGFVWLKSLEYEEATRGVYVHLTIDHNDFKHRTHASDTLRKRGLASLYSFKKFATYGIEPR